MIKKLLDFCTIVAFCCTVTGISIIRAEEPVLRKALAMVNEGRAEEAISLLNQELQTSKETPETHLGLGVAYLEKGDLVSARASLEKAVAMKSDSVPAHYTLAMMFEKQRDYVNAMDEWRKVLLFTDDRGLKDLAAKHIEQVGNRR